MKTETKLKRARDKRAALVLAEADLKEKEHEAALKARSAEFAELNEAIQSKLERYAALRTRFLQLLDQSEQVVSRDLAPSWLAVHTEAAKAQESMQAFCRRHGLPEPRFPNGFRELEQAAPWLPLPVSETINPNTGELLRKAHPGYNQFTDALATTWRDSAIMEVL